MILISTSMLHLSNDSFTIFSTLIILRSAENVEIPLGVTCNKSCQLVAGFKVYKFSEMLVNDSINLSNPRKFIDTSVVLSVTGLPLLETL